MNYVMGPLRVLIYFVAGSQHREPRNPRPLLGAPIGGSQTVRRTLAETVGCLVEKSCSVPPRVKGPLRSEARAEFMYLCGCLFRTPHSSPNCSNEKCEAFHTQSKIFSAGPNLPAPEQELVKSVARLGVRLYRPG